MSIYYGFIEDLSQQSFTGYKLSNLIRSKLCSKIFKKNSKNITIKLRTYFGNSRNIIIGSYSRVSINCKFENYLEIEDYVLMDSGC